MLKKIIRQIPGSRRVARWLGLLPDPTDGRRFLLERLPKQSVGAEIGVHVGDFSEQILDIVSPRELHLIDPWEHHTEAEYDTAWYGGAARGGQIELDQRYQSVCRRFERQVDAGQLQIHRGYSTDVLERFPDGHFDWVYIDGNHRYEFVKKDLELSFRKTKVGGLVTGDDYTEGGWWEGGVKKAVDEFAQRAGVRQVELRHQQFAFEKSG